MSDSQRSIKCVVAADPQCQVTTDPSSVLLLQLILNAKCQAIRDAQLLEKDQITRELTDEEKRLDDMMEIDRVNAIRMEEEIQHKIRQERLIGAKKIMDQIAENEQVGVDVLHTFSGLLWSFLAGWCGHCGLPQMSH